MDAASRFRYRATDTFEHFQRLVMKEALHFWRTTGGCRDDIVAEAFHIFLQAFISYDSSRSAFTTWLTFRLRKDLATFRIQRMRRQHEELTDVEYVPQNNFDIDEFSKGLSTAAQVAVSVALAMPTALQKDADERGGQPRCFRAALRSWLLREGYSPAEVTQAFQEIQQAL